MAKIFSILTLLIAAGAAYLGMESNKLVQTLQTKGQENYDGWQKTKKKLSDTEAELKTMTADRDKQKAELEATSAKLATAVEDLGKAKTELAAAMTAKDSAEKSLADIKSKIKEAFPTGDIDDIPKLVASISEMTNKVKELEATVTSLTTKVANEEAKVAGLESDKKMLEEQSTAQKKKIDRYVNYTMEKGIRGRVLAVNAGWGFCVISIGDKQGAAPNKTLVVARGGQAIGKVKITNVEASQSIADILPGTFARNAYVQPGDTVVYTGDERPVLEENLPGGANSTNPGLPVR
jgi:predicted phage tail protein